VILERSGANLLQLETSVQGVQNSVQSVLAAIQLQQQQLEEFRTQLAEQVTRQAEMRAQQAETDTLRGLTAQPPQPSTEEHLGNIVAARMERMFTQHAQKESIL
jgi:hypothetical protein